MYTTINPNPKIISIEYFYVSKEVLIFLKITHFIVRRENIFQKHFNNICGVIKLLRSTILLK